MTIINYNNYKAVQVLYCIGKCCDDATLMQLIKAFQLVYCMGLLVVSTAYIFTKVDSVHNRTNLEKVTPVPEVSTPIQYTTAQDMFRCRHRWFSI